MTRPRRWYAARSRPRLRPVGMVALSLLLVIVGGVLGWVVSAITPVRYTAHSYVLVTNRVTGADVSAVNVAQAVARVATSESVLTSRDGGAGLREAAAQDRLTASASPDAPLVDLAATASTAGQAAALANDFARQTQRHVSTFGGVAKVRAEVFAFASPPSSPSAPKTTVDVISGAALGALAAAVVFVSSRRRSNTGLPDEEV